ncbi:zinc finger protein Xfin [Culex pipiens pallens]|uniref:zinc finger protein Xfin n=1 Tax=Culex pipiens pallens TaxID=42434 RepID=UPI0019547A9C|nr:zinc finger protein Xfin [Culex pipiens pallens]
MCTKNLSCPLCCRSNFPNIDALRISLLKVTSRPLKCPICVDEVLGLDKLTIHLFGHSILGPEDGKPPPPPVEKKKPPTTTSQLKSVRKSRSTPKTQPIEPSRCGICGDEFRDQSLLQMHQSVFHEIPIRPLEEKPPLTFQCTMCPKVFKMKGSLKIHMRVVHLGCPKKAATVTTNGSSAVPPSDPPPAYPSTDVVHCNIPKTPPPLAAVQPTLAPPPPLQPVPQLPQQIHHQPPAQTVTISTSPMSQPQIIKIIDPRQLAEFIYVTNQQQQLQQQQHQQVVERAIINATPPSSVPPSPKDLTTTSNSSAPSPSQPTPQLNSPQATTPQGGGADPNKQWECDVCKKSFTTKYFLKKHKRLHTGEMPYSCKICFKSFTFQQSYHKHLLYHSDDKPHVCSQCGRAFKELSTLHNHERIHSGEKPFSCETCGKCFRQRVSYLVHRRIHTNTQPYKCTACEKSFRYKVSQRTHKCPAQPPGTVIRQTGDLLQKLLQSSAILPTLQEQQPSTASPPPAPPSSVETEQTPDEEDDATRSDDYINRTLDELLKESYDKMGISGDQSQLYAAMDGGSGGSSTSGVGESSVLVPRIENLCLMSPGPRGDLMSFDGESMEVIDSYKLDLLYN